MAIEGLSLAFKFQGTVFLVLDRPQVLVEVHGLGDNILNVLMHVIVTSLELLNRLLLLFGQQ